MSLKSEVETVSEWLSSTVHRSESQMAGTE